MMKLGVQKNRFSPGCDKWTDEDYYIYLSPNAELMTSPVYLVEFRMMESVCCTLVAIKNVEGDKEWSNDCVIFRNNEVGRDIYNRFMECEDISKALKDGNVEPLPMVPVVKVHVDENDKPVIVNAR